MMSNGNGIVRDAAAGALAGVAATWIMGQVTSYLYEQEDDQAREQEDEARGGRTAYDVAAEKAAASVDVELSDEQRQKLGSGIHWALGAGAGAVYGALKGRLPVVDAGRGLAYGAAFWGIVDEGANAALGVTPGPQQFPWQTHARGLAGHLVFGVVADALLSGTRRVLA
jgi:hypothetical protein